ncbi:thioredoxin-dependent thiol peroxidase [Ferruginivarius sediminum]|uniref:thioredoxin-dependent peroxiredoxin n=1 Tax=Ferruginivarius sediminum TaxID=2661937 RepID=A0A369T938_9PROT|nr:thioredoxin-dependent thiol peroxidase [Ferruginivarius sediminum]RDD60885.1 thioredoxin-dependent thiol peroxidase [Ferruginivarius sediminum]
MSLDVGDSAPDFSLPRDGGGTMTLADLKGKPTVLYFYPKDDTPGCTKEACGFRDAWQDVSDHGIQVIGVSKDSPKRHDNFKAKYELPFPLIADEQGELCEAFGVWKEKNMYGKKSMGIERSTFLLDGDGVIRKVWRKVKVDGHVDKLLEAAKAL